MPHWHYSGSYSRARSDCRNAQKHCVEAFSRFSELLIDYLGPLGNPVIVKKDDGKKWHWYFHDV